MKVQIQQQAVRVRIGEDELSRLLAGGRVENRTELPGHITWSQQLALHAQSLATLSARVGELHICLPHDQVLALRDRLPSRDGLQFDIECGSSPLTLQFDVDVRDSVRRRGALRADARKAAPSSA